MTARQIEDAAARLRQAADLLPAWMRGPLERLPQVEQAMAEEIRLRAGQPMTVVVPVGEVPIPGADRPIRPGDLSLVLEVATRASAHTALDRVRNGFVTAQGGHRIGLCGSVVLREGTAYNLRQLSSLCIRVARQVPGAASPIVDALRTAGGVESTLILSPPGGGKTTLLRDLIRALSVGEGGPALRVGVADERGELAALWEGMPQLDVGPHTDVLDGGPKAEGLMMLLRGMGPQVLAADEITAPADIAALEAAANCGVALLATAHARDETDLRRRSLYRTLLDRGIFRKAVWIEGRGAERRYRLADLEETSC